MDGMGRLQADGPPISDLVVRRFASRVVSELARSAGSAIGRPNPAFLQMLIAVGRHGDPVLLARMHDQMRRQRISAEQVADIYLPAAITEIGEAWHDDRITILDATIALSRLQVLLRELGLAWQSERVRGEASGCVLLVQPEGEQHSLGAMLAANQLRRLGVSVRVELMASPRSLDRLLAARRFDALFVSVSNLDALPVAAGLVAQVRGHGQDRLPVVLGGGVLAMRSEDDASPDAMIRAVKADLVTTRLREAVAFCGLQKPCAAAGIAAE